MYRLPTTQPTYRYFWYRRSDIVEAFVEIFPIERSKVVATDDKGSLLRGLMASFLQQLLRAPQSAHCLVNERHGHVIATHLLTAFDSNSRRTGLLKHDSLPEGNALLIAPCNAIHTFFMRFDIDVAFVAKDGRILKVRHAMRPWRIAGALRGFAVVELPAGVLARSETRAGDPLGIRTR